MADPSFEIPVKKEHKCPCCEESFLALEEFINHLKCCFPIGGMSSSSSSGLDHSIVSGTTTLQPVAMVQPQSSIIPPKYRCLTCNKSFARKRGLTTFQPLQWKMSIRSYMFEMQQNIYQERYLQLSYQALQNTV